MGNVSRTPEHNGDPEPRSESIRISRAYLDLQSAQNRETEVRLTRLATWTVDDEEWARYDERERKAAEDLERAIERYLGVLAFEQTRNPEAHSRETSRFRMLAGFEKRMQYLLRQMKPQ